MSHSSTKTFSYCVKHCQERFGSLCSRGTVVFLHREIVPPRETVAIARVAIAIVGRGG